MSLRRACGLALLVLAVACLAVQRRVAVRAELLARRVSLDAVEGAQPAANPEPAGNWWAHVVSKTAAQVFWPHHKLLPLQGNQKVLLSPGELSGVTRHQREMQRSLDATKADGASARAKRQGLQLLNPGELSGELKDPDDPWGYSHPRCRGLPTCSDSTSSPAVKRHQAGLLKFAHGNYYTNIARQGMHRLGADGTHSQKSTPQWLYIVT